MKAIDRTTVQLRLLTLYTERPFKGSGADVRRAITARFADIPVLHNHCGDGFDYRSPRVRYLSLDGLPRLLSFDDGLDIVERIYSESPDLQCGGQLYRVTGTELHDYDEEAGLSGGLYHYRSHTPWLALNEENHQRYLKAGNALERRRLLERIMPANMLALAKNIALDVQGTIDMKLLNFREIQIKAGDTPMLGFKVEFVTNFRIPLYIGIGKMVSKGFGVMRLLD